MPRKKLAKPIDPIFEPTPPHESPDPIASTNPTPEAVIGETAAVPAGKSRTKRTNMPRSGAKSSSAPASLSEPEAPSPDAEAIFSEVVVAEEIAPSPTAPVEVSHLDIEPVKAARGAVVPDIDAPKGVSPEAIPAGAVAPAPPVDEPVAAVAAKSRRTRKTAATKAAPASAVEAISAVAPEIVADAPASDLPGVEADTDAEPEPLPQDASGEEEVRPKAGRRRRGRSKTARPVEPEVVASPDAERAAAPVAAAEPAVVEAKKAPGRRGRKAKHEAVPEPASLPADYDFASLLLPEPVWRPRQGAATVTAREEFEADDEAGEGEDTSADGASGESDFKRRRRRRRRGRPTGPDEVTEVAAKDRAKAPEPVKEALTVAEKRPEPAKTPEKEDAPTRVEEAPVVRRDRPTIKAPEKAAIAVPEDAPQIVVRNGVPTLVRNHRVYPPIMFFGSPADERRAEIVLEQVRMAAEAGVHLHSYLIDFDVDLERVDEAAKFAAFILARSVQIDPDSQVIFRLVFQAPRGWNERYPAGAYKDASGALAEPSVCDDQFWSEARSCLERFVRQMRLLKQSDQILGVHLERGEWFFAEGAGYDDSRAAQTKFREWARMRYLDDEVTLRASWFDGAARFDTIRIPDYQPEGQEGERFIRSSRRQRRYVDYHLFLSDATVQRIADLAYAAKAASEGYFLIGASYGYTFEWSHPASGHLSLGKLLRTPEIDFIAGPPSYRSRQPGGSAPFPCPIDSFALNGKLYISEEDFKTSLSVGHEPDDFNPQLKTPQALESVHWRGAGAALAHASGVAWMDLWGNGWLRTHSVWERAKKIREAMVDRLAAPLDDPEVAVFIDERALAYLVDSHAFKLLVQNVRESVLRAGVSAAFYLLSDLTHREKFPESKVYIFVNAWDVRPELRAAIKSRLQRDKKVLFWLYTAGLFDAGRESLERAREVTGIAIKPQPFFSRAGTTILNRRHPLSEAFPDRNLVGGTKLEPSYFAIPEGATVLGEYTQTGLPSFVVKEFREGPAETHWTSVFLGEPQVNPALIRALAQMAGAHVWNFHEDVVHVRHPFCTVHCQGAGPRAVTLPGKFSAYNLLNDEWSAVDSPNLRFNALDGSTYCFLVGPRAELEHQLHADPRTVLHIDKLPPREANVRVDSSNFDVPIMKLDEWMEGSDSDDNADEWFLRPQQIEEEPPTPAEESPERLGRRRRRRRDGKPDRERSPDRGGAAKGETATVHAEPSSDFDDAGLNFMFRKRE